MSTPAYATPAEAEQAFYDAFQRGDLEAMMNVWADDESIVCVHPMGPRLEGRAAVEESWRRIFMGSSSMRFEITNLHRTQDAELCVHCVYENIDHGERLRQHSIVIATNVYRRTDAGWRMIVHHASPGAAEGAQVQARRPRSLH